jgi:hypothetical protein
LNYEKRERAYAQSKTGSFYGYGVAEAQPTYQARWSYCIYCRVKLLITNNAFCIVQRATAQSKTGIFVIVV